MVSKKRESIKIRIETPTMVTNSPNDLNCKKRESIKIRIETLSFFRFLMICCYE